MTSWIEKLEDGGSTPGNDGLSGLYPAISYGLLEMFGDLCRRVKQARPQRASVFCSDRTVKLTYGDAGIELVDEGLAGETGDTGFPARMTIKVAEGAKQFQYDVVLLKDPDYRWAVRTGPRTPPVPLTAGVLENIFRNALAKYIVDV